jgi:hypothetical protein
MQELLIALIFLVAAAYLGSRAYRSFFARNEAGCGKGCGCATDQKKPVITASVKP